MQWEKLEAQIMHYIHLPQDFCMCLIYYHLLVARPVETIEEYNLIT